MAWSVLPTSPHPYLPGSTLARPWLILDRLDVCLALCVLSEVMLLPGLPLRFHPLSTSTVCGLECTPDTMVSALPSSYISVWGSSRIPPYIHVYAHMWACMHTYMFSYMDIVVYLTPQACPETQLKGHPVKGSCETLGLLASDCRQRVTQPCLVLCIGSGSRTSEQ